MTEEKKAGQDSTGTTPTSAPKQTGDPGRTPGSAEGDREDVDESLRKKGDEADAGSEQ